jgi:hypothetical protein
MTLSPIILFVYNRPKHTAETVEALKKNEFASESVLYVFSDGAKEDATEEQKNKIREIRNYIHTITGFKELIIEEAPKNKGLANSVIYGVTKVINKHGKAIVVEDDIVTHPFFLRFMNECLDKYEDRRDIFMIGGYNMAFKFPWWYRKDIYVVHRSCSWGWATWKSRWDLADWSVSDYSIMCQDINLQNKFNRGGNDMFPMLTAQMNGKIDSWAIRWDYSLYKHDAVCIRPVRTLVTNNGMDGTGIHCKQTDDKTAKPYNKLTYEIKLYKRLKVYTSIEQAFKNTFYPAQPHPPFSYKIRRFLADIGLYNCCRYIKHLFLQ